MNKGFLSLIDLSTNVQRAMVAMKGISGGLAALMAIGLTILACGLVPLVWFFDVSATLDYSEPLVGLLLPTLAPALVAQVAWFVVALTTMPTIVELLLPRIAERVPAVAFLVFGFVMIDAITDYPRVASTMLAYKPFFSDWGFVGTILWHICHVPLLLFATLLFELLLALCVALVGMLVLRVFANEFALKKGLTSGQ